MLRSVLDHPNFPWKLQKLNKLLDRAEITTTYLGSRVITIEESGESICLNQIAEKIAQAAFCRSLSDDFTVIDRVSGFEIVRKIQNFYLIGDRQIEKSLCFTRCFARIRENSCTCSPARFVLKTSCKNYFRGYSEREFNKTFSFYTKQEGSIGAFGGYRILVAESEIRLLGNKPFV